jgi:transposase
MGRIKSIELTCDERTALERGFRDGKTHAFRTRCHMILLKSCGLRSIEIAEQVGCCEVVINNWLKRYQEHGISGLSTQQGQGRKPILDPVEDLEKVRIAVQAHRQRIRVAKAELEAELGKTFSNMTLKRFLKNIAADTSV